MFWALKKTGKTVYWRSKHWILNFPFTCCRHYSFLMKTDFVCHKSNISTIKHNFTSHRYSGFITSGTEIPYSPSTHGGPPTINISPSPSKKSSKQVEAVAPKVAAMVNRLCLPRKKLTGLKRKKTVPFNEEGRVLESNFKYFEWIIQCNSNYITFPGSILLYWWLKRWRYNKNKIYTRVEHFP